MTIKKIYKDMLLCALSGIALGCAFPKINLFFLAWAAFIPLFYVICRAEKPVYSFLYAFLAGAVFNLQANFWLISTVDLFADNYPISIIFYVFFCLYFALYWGVWGLFSSAIKKYCSKPWLFVILSACVWVVLEYVRSYVLSGWPWLCIAYSQYIFTYIIQISEFTGIYGLSFSIMFVNGFLYFGIFEKKKFYLPAAAALFLAIFLLGVVRFNMFQDFGDNAFKAAAVQSNIEQYKKLDYSHKEEINRKLAESAAELAEIGASLNVWSENEIINLIPDDTQAYGFADGLAKKAGGINVIGAPYLDKDGKLFNAVFYFDGNGGFVSMHTKNHLIPFGEYLPISEGLADLLNITEKSDDLIKGKDTAVFKHGNIYAGALICSENFFPDIVRRFVLSGAKVFTNHTNDAWFFDSSAPHKHFCANVFRAVESRKAIIVAANTGVSAIVDASGKVLVSTKVCERAIIEGTVLQNGYMTFYVIYGDVFVKLCIMFLVIFTAVTFLRRRINNGV